MQFCLKACEPFVFVSNPEVKTVEGSEYRDHVCADLCLKSEHWRGAIPLPEQAPLWRRRRRIRRPCGVQRAVRADRQHLRRTHDGGCRRRRVVRCQARGHDLRGTRGVCRRIRRVRRRHHVDGRRGSLRAAGKSAVAEHSRALDSSAQKHAEFSSTILADSFSAFQAKPVGFAAPTSQPSAGGLFGGAPGATTGFGATAAQPTAAVGAFGAPAASTGFAFGATNTAPATGGTGLFGQQAKPAFGAATTGQFLQFNRKMANRVQHSPDESTY